MAREVACQQQITCEVYMKSLVVETVLAVNNAIDGKVAHNAETAKIAVKMLHRYYSESIGNDAAKELVKALLIGIKHTRCDSKCNEILLSCLGQFE